MKRMILSGRKVTIFSVSIAENAIQYALEETRRVGSPAVFEGGGRPCTWIKKYLDTSPDFLIFSWSVLLQLVILNPVRLSPVPPVTTILVVFELWRPPDEGVVLPSPKNASRLPVGPIS